MINKLNKITTKKNFTIAVIVISILLMIPILWVSFYTTPSADDFGYGKYTINVLQTKGIIELFRGSVKQLVETYYTWQGTYSATILFTLTPAVLGEKFYFLTTFFILGIYFFSLAFLFKQVLIKILKIDKYSYIIVLLLFFMLCVETLINKTQGLYWWNGATYYITFFSLELIEIGLLIKKYFLNNNKKRYNIILPILILLIGGGNFVIALQQVIILAFLNLYLIIKRKDKSALMFLLFSILGLAISVCAPGNASRQSMVVGMNPIKAILFSFTTALSKIIEWSSPLNIGIIILIIAFLYPTYDMINEKFSHPLLFVIIIYCIFSAMFTPTLYSISDIGPDRLLNIIYFSLLLFQTISIYYLIGYLRRQLIENKILCEDSSKKLIKFVQKNSFVILFIATTVIAILIFFSAKKLTSFQTARIIKNNEITTYREEWLDRYKVLKNKSIRNVEFKELTYYPNPIFYTDFTKDKNDWLNQSVCEIYDKDSVVIIDSSNGRQE